MTPAPACNIAECSKPAHARGWCRMHYMRWWTHGDVNTVLIRQSPAGSPTAFLNSALSHGGEECLLWPFAQNGAGYAQILHGGRKALVSRIVCEFVKGPPPSPKHHAAHKCGNGHLGCIAPLHLRWATPRENSIERGLHGRTQRGSKAKLSKLTEAQVLKIFDSRNSGVPQHVTASYFGISQTLVSAIRRGARWNWLTGAA